MRNTDRDQGVVARAQFENPFTGAEFGFSLQEEDTLLVRVDVGGYPAASLQGAHREAGVHRRIVLPDNRPAAESFALALERRRDGEVGFATPSNKVSTRCQRRSCNRHPTGCSFFLAAVSVR